MPYRVVVVAVVVLLLLLLRLLLLLLLCFGKLLGCRPGARDTIGDADPIKRVAKHGERSTARRVVRGWALARVQRSLDVSNQRVVSYVVLRNALLHHAGLGGHNRVEISVAQTHVS